MISVGSFRGIHRAAAAALGATRAATSKFKLYQLDYDERMTERNGETLQHLDSAPGRRAFLSALVNGPGNKPPTRVSEQAFVDALTPAYRDGEHMMLGFLRGHVRSDVWSRSIFGNDELFAMAQRQARARVQVPLNGSIAGDRTMPALSTALSAQGRKVSVVDLSNALEHVFTLGMEIPPEEGTKLRHQLVANLRGLPYAPDALVLVTSKYSQLPPRSGRHEDNWTYYALRAADVLVAADKGYLRSRSAYEEFLRVAGQRDASGSKHLYVEPPAGFAASLPVLDQP